MGVHAWMQTSLIPSSTILCEKPIFTSLIKKFFHVQVFWVVTPYSVAVGFQRF